jgi:hypothetical protein
MRGELRKNVWRYGACNQPVAEIGNVIGAAKSVENAGRNSSLISVTAWESRADFLGLLHLKEPVISQ